MQLDIILILLKQFYEHEQNMFLDYTSLRTILIIRIIEHWHFLWSHSYWRRFLRFPFLYMPYMLYVL